MDLKPPSLTVYFGNLDAKVTDKLLYELGCQAGPVVRAQIASSDKLSSTSRRSFGFVQYADLASSIFCVGLYRGLLKLFGLNVQVNFANQEVAADDITPEHEHLLEKCKKMWQACLAGPEPGAGVARRGGFHQERFAPYGAPPGRRDRRPETQQPYDRQRHPDWQQLQHASSSDAAAGAGAGAGAGARPTEPSLSEREAAARKAAQLIADALTRAPRDAAQTAATAAGAAPATGGIPVQSWQQQQQQHKEGYQLLHQHSNGQQQHYPQAHSGYAQSQGLHRQAEPPPPHQQQPQQKQAGYQMQLNMVQSNSQQQPVYPQPHHQEQHQLPQAQYHYQNNVGAAVATGGAAGQGVHIAWQHQVAQGPAVVPGLQLQHIAPYQAAPTVSPHAPVQLVQTTVGQDPQQLQQQQQQQQQLQQQQQYHHLVHLNSNGSTVSQGSQPQQVVMLASVPPNHGVQQVHTQVVGQQQLQVVAPPHPPPGWSQWQPQQQPQQHVYYH